MSYKRIIFCILLTIIVLFNACKKETKDITETTTEEKTEVKKEVTAEGELITSYGWSTKPAESDAVNEAITMMQNKFGATIPKLVLVVSVSSKYDEKKIFTSLKSVLDPATKIWGLASSDNGHIVPDSLHTGISVMGFHAPEMVVGIGTATMDDWQDFAAYPEIGKTAINNAIKDAGKTAADDPPAFIIFGGLNLVTDTHIFNGIEEIVGKNVPIIGGNSVDEDLWTVGKGSTYSSEGSHAGKISIAAVWMNRKVGLSYGYGYKKTEHKGIATKSDFESRVLFEIDNRPAADVYNEWVDGKITELIEQGGGPIDFNVFAKNPFSKVVGESPSDYVMIAPLAINPDKSIFMTHEGIEEGKEITVYELDPDDIVVKPAMMATIAMARGRISKDEIAGALSIYCDAPFLVFKGDLGQIIPNLNNKINNQPYIGFFASGEIGYQPQTGNRCLAYSSVVMVFGKK